MEYGVRNSDKVGIVFNIYGVVMVLFWFIVGRVVLIICVVIVSESYMIDLYIVGVING